ncbi:MerR family transcriptional regulator [Sneathiella sp. CAU 1612]|uniref:MerR family transcriptional regulator n=1 Tax=Sneathiella sedimenti TaxID=2816034 RepID=A0ABS3F7E5_9PROT|nr:MerR family transcriptional regulator [Sneathiella sedimenti]MBO0334439.1 MerR family transcriptional regulator [Sneathiella sedimenti]
MQKSPDAFRTISEVSTELEVPQHVLRFWETKFKVVKPLKRGGGRRYYRPSDVELIRGIRDLLYKHGFTIRGAQKLLKEQGGRIDNVDAMVSAARAEGNPALSPTESNGGNGGSDPLSGEAKVQLRRVLSDLKELKEMLA